MPTVRFLPAEVEVELQDDETLAQAARRANVPYASMCGGLGSCGGCRVKILEGEEHLSEMGPTEKGRLGNTFFITKERLACQTRCSGPMVVEVVQVEVRDKRSRARRRALNRTIENAQRRAERQAERERNNQRRRGRRPDASPPEAAADRGGNGRSEPPPPPSAGAAGGPPAPPPSSTPGGPPADGSQPAPQRSGWRRRRRRRRSSGDAARQR